MDGQKTLEQQIAEHQSQQAAKQQLAMTMESSGAVQDSGPVQVSGDATR